MNSINESIKIVLQKLSNGDEFEKEKLEFQVF